MDGCAGAGSLEDVTQIAGQAVGQINGGAGDATQGHAKGHPWLWPQQAGQGEIVLRCIKLEFAAQVAQRQPRVAEGPADPDIVSRLRCRAA